MLLLSEASGPAPILIAFALDAIIAFRRDVGVMICLLTWCIERKIASLVVFNKTKRQHNKQKIG